MVCVLVGPSSNRYDPKLEIAKAVASFSEQGFPFHIINKLHLLYNTHILGGSRPMKTCSQDRKLWLVLQYFRCFEYSKFERNLKAFFALPWVISALDFHAIKIEAGVSWSNGSRNLLHTLRGQSISFWKVG